MIVDVSAGGIEWRYRAMLLGDTAERHSRVVWPSDLAECLSLMRQVVSCQSGLYGAITVSGLPRHSIRMV